MTKTIFETINLMELLPEADQAQIYDIVKKFVIAWDPDFTKMTESEQRAVELAEKEIENGECVSLEKFLNE